MGKSDGRDMSVMISLFAESSRNRRIYVTLLGLHLALWLVSAFLINFMSSLRCLVVAVGELLR